jgi:enoyl-CoA hydratase
LEDAGGILTTHHSAGRIGASVTSGVGWIALNNPKKHNAMSLDMWTVFQEVLSAFACDPTVRCIVVRGEGEQAFCAGGDLDEKQGVDGDEASRNAMLTLAGMRAIQAFPKPSIAMISGYCLGGGLALALGCDLRLAGTGATFGIPAAKLGLSYFFREIKVLTDLVGPSRAKALLFTADRVDADRALQMGLVDEVVPKSELAAYTDGFAKRIAANAPLSHAAAKRAITLATESPSDEQIAACDALAVACLASKDFVEGRLAFREKRPPLFNGC